MRIDLYPAAIVYPYSLSQIQEAVKCGASAKIPVTPRSGGHGYTGACVGGTNGSLVIDLSNFKSVSMKRDGSTVVVDSGTRLGELAVRLWEQGKRVLPHGSCPYVGTGGQTSFGGIGPLSRKYGLLLDQVVSAQVVLADGSLVTASKSSHEDLFWAIRGAAPSFGIVTSWTFTTYPAPRVSLAYTIRVVGAYESEYREAMAAAQEFSASLKTMTDTSLLLLMMPFDYSADKDWVTLLTILGEFTPQNATLATIEAQFDERFKPLIDRLPSFATVEKLIHADWIDSFKNAAFNQPLMSTAPEHRETFLSRSFITTEPLSPEAVNSWVSYMYKEGKEAKLDWWIHLELNTGYMNTIPADATAFPHRSAFITYQIAVNVPEVRAASQNGRVDMQSVPKYPSAAFPFLEKLMQSIQPNGITAAYPNYADPTLSPAQWKSQYFGSNYERLTKIKRELDPKNVFSFPQSIEVAQ